MAASSRAKVPLHLVQDCISRGILVLCRKLKREIRQCVCLLNLEPHGGFSIGRTRENRGNVNEVSYSYWLTTALFNTL